MSTTYDLFTRWKAAKGHRTDSEALAALGVSHGAAVHWKAGREAEADVIERMANDLGEDAAALAMRAMAGRSRGEVARAWERLADRVTGRLMPIMSTAARAVRVALGARA